MALPPEKARQFYAPKPAVIVEIDPEDEADRTGRPVQPGKDANSGSRPVRFDPEEVFPGDPLPDTTIRIQTRLGG